MFSGPGHAQYPTAPQSSAEQLRTHISRRDCLRLGGAGAFGLSLAGLQARTRASTIDPTDRTFGRARSCIIIFLAGGPPQHETWDPKPAAPIEVRGPFAPIDTATPGMQVGELMPLTARHSEHIAVLRAMSTGDHAHSSSGYWMLTGTPHTPTNVENAPVGFPNNNPSLAAIVQHLSGGAGRLPAAVRMPDHIWNTGGIPWPGQDGGWLGRNADPWMLTCDPNAADFAVPGLGLPAEVATSRFDGRKGLLASINQRIDTVDRSGIVDRWSTLNQQCFDLIRAPEVRRAFDLDSEPAELRDRYGRSRFGQSMLLARRLVESGVSLVQVNWPRAKDDANDNPMWDTHTKNAERCKTALMPPMDAAYSTLLDDLSKRGLLDETLVVWMGEFGRSPKINPAGGRDHWGHVFSVALAGGGVRGGQVVGSSDSLGGYARSGRVAPQDLAATVLHCLGHHPSTELTDPLGRQLPISRGEVLRSIL